MGPVTSWDGPGFTVWEATHGWTTVRVGSQRRTVQPALIGCLFRKCKLLTLSSEITHIITSEEYGIFNTGLLKKNQRKSILLYDTFNYRKWHSFGDFIWDVAFMEEVSCTLWNPKLLLLRQWLHNKLLRSQCCALHRRLLKLNTWYEAILFYFFSHRLNVQASQANRRGRCPEEVHTVGTSNG